MIKFSYYRNMGPYGASFSDGIKDDQNIEVMGSTTLRDILTNKKYKEFSKHIKLFLHGHEHDSHGYEQKYGLFSPILNPGAALVVFIK